MIRKVNNILVLTVCLFVVLSLFLWFLFFVLFLSTICTGRGPGRPRPCPLPRFPPLPLGLPHPPCHCWRPGCPRPRPLFEGPMYLWSVDWVVCGGGSWALSVIGLWLSLIISDIFLILLTSFTASKSLFMATSLSAVELRTMLMELGLERLLDGPASSLAASLALFFVALSL